MEAKPQNLFQKAVMLTNFMHNRFDDGETKVDLYDLAY